MKKSKYWVKIICGYRKEQEYTINANEAHKAYYLFNHPNKRGTFSNGLALRGSDIQRIVPDYQTTMGWNPTHQLTDDDYNELGRLGITNKFSIILSLARFIGREGVNEDIALPLHTLHKGKYANLSSGSLYSQKVLEAKKEN